MLDTKDEKSWDTNLEANFTSLTQFLKEWFVSQGSPAGIFKVGSPFNCFQECSSSSCCCQSCSHSNIR
eukprot:3659212-Prorocentrum_lima.AAC.1